MDPRKLVFVCLHGAAKSVIAAAHAQRLAEQRGLGVTTTFAGTEPDPEIAPRVVTELLAEGIDVRAHRPHRVTREDLAGAWRVVSFGCDVGARADGAPVERWDDVPAVSEDYTKARDAIDAHVVRLLRELSQEERGAIASR